MFVVILLILVVLVVWQLSGSGRSFVRDVAQLVERPVADRSALTSFLTGRYQVLGECAGRPATLTLQERRGRHSLGYLQAGIEAVAAKVPLGDDTGGFQDSITDRDGRRALYDLTVKHDVSLKLNGRWLTATSMPVGVMLFPGRFDRDRWRDVLAAMRTVVRSLERDGVAQDEPPAPPAI